MPAIQSYFIEPIFEQFRALLPKREVNHPLGCHRPRIPDRVVFEKLLQVLVFGCAYWRIADESCSETTLRRRRDEWIDLGVMDALREMVLEVYDQIVGLDMADVAVDGCITKAPCGGEKAGRSPVDRGKAGHQTLNGGGCARHPARHRHRPGQPSRLAAANRDPAHRQRDAGRVAREGEGASGPCLRLEGHPRAATTAWAARRDLREG